MQKRVMIWSVLFSLFTFLSFSYATESDLYQQGIELLKNKQYGEATSILEQYLAQDSTNAKAYYNLGLAYANLEKFPNAVSAWQQAIRLNPKFEQAHYNLGLLYLRPTAYHTSEATTEFLIVIKLNPHNYKAHYQLARGYYQLGIFKKVVEETDIVLQLKPDLLAASELKMLAYQYLNDLPAAIQMAKTLYRKDTNETNKSNLYNFYKIYGINLCNEKKYQPALAQLSLAQKLEPKNQQINYELAITYMAMGQIQQAGKLFELALQADPKNPDLLNNLAYLYADNHYQLDRATLLIDSAARLLSNDDDARLLTFLDTKGWIEFQKKNYTTAYTKFSTALVYERENELTNQSDYNTYMQLRYHAALAAWELDKKDESRELLNQILAVKSDNPTALEWQKKTNDWVGAKEK